MIYCKYFSTSYSIKTMKITQFKETKYKSKFSQVIQYNNRIAIKAFHSYDLFNMRAILYMVSILMSKSRYININISVDDVCILYYQMTLICLNESHVYDR